MYGLINYYKNITPYNSHPIKKQNLACHLQRPSMSPSPVTAPQSTPTWTITATTLLGFFLVLSTKYTSLHTAV